MSPVRAEGRFEHLDVDYDEATIKAARVRHR